MTKVEKFASHVDHKSLTMVQFIVLLCHFEFWKNGCSSIQIVGHVVCVVNHLRWNRRFSSKLIRPLSLVWGKLVSQGINETCWFLSFLIMGERFIAGRNDTSRNDLDGSKVTPKRDETIKSNSNSDKSRFYCWGDDMGCV